VVVVYADLWADARRDPGGLIAEAIARDLRPPLGPDFIAHVSALIEAQRPDLQPVDQAALQQAFEKFGSRPQFFMAALSGRFEPAMLEAAQEQQAQDEAQMESDYLGLKRAVAVGR
jgi:hypothetical protein